MTADIKKQINGLVKNSATPLILIPERSNLDAISGALGLFLMFKKMNKEAQVLCSSPVNEKFQFLPEIKSITREISNEAIYKVAVNVAKNDLVQVSYDQVNDLLNIYLTVKKGKIKVDSVVLDGAKYKYDLVIVLAAPNLNSLGRIYFENRDMFLNVPIVNIDHNGANGRFGAVNLIESTSAGMINAIAEIIKDVLPSGIEEKIATLLLSSVISATDNFQAPKIDPAIFSLAAYLINSGAKREEIIGHLYGLKTANKQSAIIVERATNAAEDILKKKLDILPSSISR